MIEDFFFEVKNEAGETHKYEMLDTFFCGETKKHYIIYTDNTFDKQGRLKVFASIYDPDEYGILLRPINSNEEWDFIEEYLKKEAKDS